MINAVRDIKFTRGSTNTAAALQYMREVMFTSQNGAQKDTPMVSLM